MRAVVLASFVAACASRGPAVHTLPPVPQPPAPVASASLEGAELDLQVDADGHVSTDGFPAVSTDGRVAVSLDALGDGMRGFPYFVMHVFDAAKGGAPLREMPIVDPSDTADRPEDDATFLTRRVAPRLAAARAVLRAKRWVPLDHAHPGLDVTLASQQLDVRDRATRRTVHSRKYPTIANGAAAENSCVFEPFEVKGYSDAAGRWLLVAVAYRSGPDWCNMDDDLDLVVLRR